MLVAMLPPLHLHPDVINLRKGIHIVRLQAEWHAANSLQEWTCKGKQLRGCSVSEYFPLLTWPGNISALHGDSVI